MGTVTAAVKTLKGSFSPDEKGRFLREAAIMGQFKHRNVLELYGVVDDGDPVCSVTWLSLKFSSVTLLYEHHVFFLLIS